MRLCGSSPCVFKSCSQYTRMCTTASLNIRVKFSKCKIYALDSSYNIIRFLFFRSSFGRDFRDAMKMTRINIYLYCLTSRSARAIVSLLFVSSYAMRSLVSYAIPILSWSLSVSLRFSKSLYSQTIPWTVFLFCKPMPFLHLPPASTWNFKSWYKNEIRLRINLTDNWSQEY